MHPPTADRSRNHLHRFAMLAVTANDRQFPAVAHQDAMPTVKRFVGQGSVKAAVELHHHLGDAGFGRGRRPAIRRQPEMPTDGGLDRVSVKEFPLDSGGLDRLLR